MKKNMKKRPLKRPILFIFCVCLPRKKKCKIWVIFWYIFLTLFPLAKDCFLVKSAFSAALVGWKISEEKKLGCRIRNFSHFFSQKMTFFSNFWTLMVFGPKARKRKEKRALFPKKNFTICPPPPPPNPNRKVFVFLKCDWSLRDPPSLRVRDPPPLRVRDPSIPYP